MSKFSPIELFESAKFYLGESSPINEARRQQGYSLAWHNHKGKNKHHWEYWVDFPESKIVPIEIPNKYVKEIIADYIGAGKAYNIKKWTYSTPLEYFEEKHKHYLYNKKTLEKLLLCLRLIKDKQELAFKEIRNILK